MEEFIGGGRSPQTNKQCRVVFYHNLSPDSADQTASAELMKRRDKNTADVYGVQLIAVYVDHAYLTQTERPAFEKMLADARNGQFDFIITKSIERFAPTAEDTVQAIEELLSQPKPVRVIFESERLDSNIIHSIVPILRGCCT